MKRFFRGIGRGGAADGADQKLDDVALEPGKLRLAQDPTREPGAQLNGGNVVQTTDRSVGAPPGAESGGPAVEPATVEPKGKWKKEWKSVWGVKGGGGDGGSPGRGKKKNPFEAIRAGLEGLRKGDSKESKETQIDPQVPPEVPEAEIGEVDIHAMALEQAKRRQEILYGSMEFDKSPKQQPMDQPPAEPLETSPPSIPQPTIPQPTIPQPTIPQPSFQGPGERGLGSGPPRAPELPKTPDAESIAAMMSSTAPRGLYDPYPAPSTGPPPSVPTTAGGPGYPPYPSAGQQAPGPSAPPPPPEPGFGAEDLAAIASGRPKRQPSMRPREVTSAIDYSSAQGGGAVGTVNPVGWGNVFGDESMATAQSMGPGFVVKPVLRPPPPVFDIPPELADKLRRSEELVKNALVQDEKANYGQAEENYMAALSILIPAIKELERNGTGSDRREKEKKKYRSLTERVLTRCETIKPFLQTNATMAVLEASSPPKTIPHLPSNGEREERSHGRSRRQRPRRAGVDYDESDSEESINATADNSTVDNLPPPPPPPEFEENELVKRISQMSSPGDAAKAVDRLPPAQPPTTQSRGTRGRNGHQHPSPDHETQVYPPQEKSPRQRPPPLPPRMKPAIEPDLSDTKGRWECGVCTTSRADVCTKCRHLFCSNCITSSLSLIPECPTCGKECSKDELIQVQPPGL